MVISFTLYPSIFRKVIIVLVLFLSFWHRFIDSVGGKDWMYFSAMCWMYGRRLYDQYSIPIGLISSNYGGTRVEAWSSLQTIARCNGRYLILRLMSFIDFLVNKSIMPTKKQNARINIRWSSISAQL